MERYVLVVEDDPLSAMITGELLACAGQRALTARDLVEARLCLDVHPVCLVLLDVCLDGARPEDFEGFLTELRTRGLPWLYVSALDPELLETMVRRTGARGMLSKPFGKRTLVRRIEEHVVPPSRPV